LSAAASRAPAGNKAAGPGRPWTAGARYRPTWVFDLDNTLHYASPHIFPHMNRSMTEYVMRHLGLDEVEASALRRSYWLRYGATLLGLIKHHQTDPAHFLDETHQFPELERMVIREMGLRGLLARLPGRKVVFSNAPERYCRAVLQVLGILDLFDAVFTIEHTGYRPKPDARGFRELFRAHRIDPRRSIMVEDSLPNLKTARRLGLRTVWIVRRGGAARVRRPGYVDLMVTDLRAMTRALGHLR
jgi:putative hydrolase of the HAD superfamily